MPYTFRHGYPPRGGWVAPFGNPRITARLPAPLGLSQVPTSFFASRRQDIHRVLLRSVTPTGRRGSARLHGSLPLGLHGMTSLAREHSPGSRTVRLTVTDQPLIGTRCIRCATQAAADPRPLGRAEKPRPIPSTRTPPEVQQDAAWGDVAFLSGCQRCPPGLGLCPVPASAACLALVIRG
jgi:hypothetical protein